jgi:transcriptional regulator
MYTPSKFKVEDAGKLAQFMTANSFATVIIEAEGKPFASHLPLLFEPGSASAGKLLGHMARANAQWRHFTDGREVLVIFHGPHAYVSPRWYQTQVEVPTWNYAVVHAYGVPQVMTDDAQFESLLQRTIRFYEGDGPDAWPGQLPSDFTRDLMRAIVGFEIHITRLEGKFKLGQNRSPADRAGVYAALSRSSEGQDNKIAVLMRSEGLVP